MIRRVSAPPPVAAASATALRDDERMEIDQGESCKVVFRRDDDVDVTAAVLRVVYAWLGEHTSAVRDARVAVRGGGTDGNQQRKLVVVPVDVMALRDFSPDAAHVMLGPYHEDLRTEVERWMAAQLDVERRTLRLVLRLEHTGLPVVTQLDSEHMNKHTVPLMTMRRSASSKTSSAAMPAHDERGAGDLCCFVRFAGVVVSVEQQLHEQTGNKDGLPTQVLELHQETSLWASPVKLVLLDDLMGQFRPGDRVSGLGVPTVQHASQLVPTGSGRQWKGSKKVRENAALHWIHVNNMHVVVGGADGNNTNMLCGPGSEPDWTVVPAGRHRVVENLNLDEWAQTVSMVKQFGQHIAPPGTYSKLKLSLLLSLHSGVQDRAVDDEDSIFKENERRAHDRVHVLVLGDDVLAHRLVAYAASRAPPKDQQVHSLRTSRRQSQLRPHDILVNTGLLVFEPGHCVRANDVEGVLDLLSGASSKHTVLMNAPLQAFCKRGKRLRSMQSSNVSGSASPEEARVATEFDLVHVVLASSSGTGTGSANRAQFDDAIADHILSIGSDPAAAVADEFPQPTIRSSIEVDTKGDAEELLQAFFLHSRQAHGYSLNHLSALVRLTRAHARMHQRAEAAIVDVVVAIMMVEESQACRFLLQSDSSAAPALGFQPQSNEALNIETSIERDDIFRSKMVSFYQQVCEFLSW